MTGVERQVVRVATGAADIETFVDGEGSPFVILPSYGRGSGEDFDDLAGRLADAGWRVLRPQPRGVGGSQGPMSGVTLHDLADDVAAVVERFGGEPAIILGHAFGHAVASLAATDHPHLVSAVILAAPQASEVQDDVARTPFIAGDVSLPDADRLAALRLGFFAPGHDPRPWLTGWSPETLRMEHEAAQSVPPADYRACGVAPVLELFGACDPFKPPRYWPELKSELGARVATTVVQDASHALFPEQPVGVAEAVLRWASRYK